MSGRRGRLPQLNQKSRSARGIVDLTLDSTLEFDSFSRKALELSLPRQTSRKQIPGLTNSDHEEHGNKRTEDVDNENNTAIYLFGEYGIWNCEKETFISISVYS